MTIESTIFTKRKDKEFKECWKLDNLQLLWAKEDLKKYNKYSEVII